MESLDLNHSDREVAITALLSRAVSLELKLNKLRTLFPFIIGLLLFSCVKKTHEDAIVNNPEIKAFVTYFFVPGVSLLKNGTEDFSLQDQAAQNLLSNAAMCSPDNPCNRTKEYFLAFNPNFLFETVNGRTIVSGADPDAFVDVCDIKGKKVYRVRQTGTEGSIYGTFWLSDLSFVVYGMESDEAFVEVYDIKEKTKTSYAIDKAKRKSDADLDEFLIAKYGKMESFQSSSEN